jgi:hypothetical protein
MAKTHPAGSRPFAENGGGSGSFVKETADMDPTWILLEGATCAVSTM